MAEPRTNRRLAAILAADVAGYSRLMGADEEGTLARLTAHRRELFDPAIAKHRGRIVKTTGDGLLAEFASVVDAVRCAAEVQAGMAARNSSANGPRIDFRIGINVGDIVEQDGDIFGDGVNIAARMEGIADPGGICVSARVQEDATGRSGIAFEDLGEQSLKNIARPIRAYRVKLEGATGAPGLVRQALGTTGGLSDRPSLAVLPFQNMSGDPEQEYFADGVVEDVITALSRFKSFAVIARNSTFVYKGRAVDIRQVGRELGVQYVLEGGVRRAGGRLRLTAQLVDAASGAHLWANRFDGAVEDVFDVQDRITESVATIVEPQIREAEIVRSRIQRPGSVAAYDLYLQALAKHRLGTKESTAEAYALLTRALALEPDNATYLAWAIECLQLPHISGWQRLSTADAMHLSDLARRALANAGDDAAVLALVGNALIQVSHEYARGLATVRRAAELNPNNLTATLLAGVASNKCGSPNEALTYFNRALRLSPTDPYAFVALTGIAHTYMMLGNYSEALAFAERSHAVNANIDFTHWMLIAANAQLGRLTAARGWVTKLLALTPDATVARISAGQGDADGTRMKVVLDGLRLAGLDEG